MNYQDSTSCVICYRICGVQSKMKIWPLLKKIQNFKMATVEYEAEAGAPLSTGLFDCTCHGPMKPAPNSHTEGRKAMTRLEGVSGSMFRL